MHTVTGASSSTSSHERRGGPLHPALVAGVPRRYPRFTMVHGDDGVAGDGGGNGPEGIMFCPSAASAAYHIRPRCPHACDSSDTPRQRFRMAPES